MPVSVTICCEGGSDLTGCFAGVAILQIVGAGTHGSAKLQVQWDEGKTASRAAKDCAPHAEELSKQPAGSHLRKEGEPTPR